MGRRDCPARGRDSRGTCSGGSSQQGFRPRPAALIVKPVVFHPEAQAEFFAAQDYTSDAWMDLAWIFAAKWKLPQKSSKRLRNGGHFGRMVPAAISFTDFPSRSSSWTCRQKSGLSP